MYPPLLPLPPPPKKISQQTTIERRANDGQIRSSAERSPEPRSFFALTSPRRSRGLENAATRAVSYGARLIEVSTTLSLDFGL